MAGKAYEISVFGKVQGVGFRFYTQRKANELKLKGYVKNKSDGSVYIEVEGAADQIEQFVLWCHEGPAWARVSKVHSQEVPPSGYDRFEIR